MVSCIELNNSKMSIPYFAVECSVALQTAVCRVAVRVVSCQYLYKYKYKYQ